jgi:hypothetical protein
MKQYLLLPAITPQCFYTDFSRAVEAYNNTVADKKTLYLATSYENGTMDLNLTMLKHSFVDSEKHVIRVSRCVVLANLNVEVCSNDGKKELNLIKDNTYDCEVITSTKNDTICALKIAGIVYPMIPRALIDILHFVS